MGAIDNIIAGINGETANITTLAQRAVPYVQSNASNFWGGECRTYDWVQRRDREGIMADHAACDARYAATAVAGSLEI